MQEPSRFSVIQLLLLATLVLTTGSQAASKTKKPVPAKAQTGTQAPAQSQPYSSRSDAMGAADEMADRLGLDRSRVRQILGQARLIPRIVGLMTPAPRGVAKNWQVYRSRFIEPLRIQAGVDFWQAQRDVLQRAEERSGVPAEIIVGVIGVETIYGQQMGSFRVIDALSTLAFDFPVSHPRAGERSAYFLSELERYLSFTQRGGIDPLSLRGSYAGAMGMPQFMPSSWQQHAVDFDADGRIDLFTSAADAIGSVANYLQAYGWNRGMATHYPLRFDPQRLDLESLMIPDILPTFSLASFQDKGVLLEGEALQHTGPLALIELQNGGAAPSYVAGTENFYVITRYNWSSYYAMAVIELGQAVAAAMGR